MTITWIRNLGFFTGLAVLGCGASGGSPPTIDAAAGISNPPDAAIAMDTAVSKPDLAADVAVAVVDAAIEVGMPDRAAGDLATSTDSAAADRTSGDLSTDRAPAPDAQSADTRPSADAPVAVTEAVGFYSGDWGAMVLRVVGTEVHGTYSHDQGTIVGTFRDGVLYAWWAEVPSREPTADAGECEFRFIRNATGKVRIDGRWRYGTQDAWREDWDIDQVDSMPPTDLLARFMDAAAFRKHP